MQLVLNPFEVVVVVAAVCCGVWLWRECTSAATSKLNATIFARAAHRRGRDATRSRLVFTSDRPAAEVQDALRARLGIPFGVQTRIFARLYVSRTTARAVEFTFGSRLHTSFRSIAVLDDLPAGGCQGSYEVRSWEESHGLVTELDQLLEVQRRVVDVLGELGATVAVAATEPKRAPVRAKRPVRIAARPPARRLAPARLTLGRARS